MKQLKKILCLLLICVLACCLLAVTAAAETVQDIAGVEMVGSGWRYNSSTGAYEPIWKSCAALSADGSAKDPNTYSISTGSFYKTYSSGSLSDKLTTAPAYGETYYASLAIDCPNGYDAKLDKNLFKVSIPGFIVEYKTDYFGDAGFTWRIIFSATRYEDVYVGGVRLQAGQCLPSGASTPQADKPETGYAYNAGKYLELNCYSYEGNGLSRKAGIYAEHDLAIKVIGNCSLYMAEGCDGIRTTQNLLYVTGGPLTIYADRCGIYAEKNVTLSNGSMTNSKLIIETNHEECVYAGNDLTVGDYAILNLNCKDTGNHGLGALMAENGYVSMGNRDVLVADKAYGTLKTPHSAADVASYPRIVVHKFTDQVIVGNVKLTDGQYLAVGGTAATTAKPSGGYAYFKDGILTLHNYTLKNSPYKTSSYTTYDEYIQIFAPKAYVLSLSGNNKLESDEKVTSAVRAPNDLFIQQAAAGGSLEIDSYKVGIYAYNSEVFFDSGNLDITSVNTGIECGNGTLFFNNCDLTINSRNTYGIFQRDDYGDPPANQNDITVIGGKLDIRSQHEGILALSAASDFRMTGGECTVVTERGSAIEAGNNIRVLGGKLYLKVVSDYWDEGNGALRVVHGKVTIASGLPVMASTDSYGQLGAYDPAKVKEYDWVTIGNPTAPQLTSYTVTFNPNGGPGETVTVTGINPGGYVRMLDAPAADWDGRSFLGWKVAGSTGTKLYAPGETFTLNKDMEFLAQWEPVPLAEAHAYIDAPTRGKTPDMTPTVPEGAHYTAQVDYYYYASSGSFYHMTATDTFPAYKICSLRIKFIPNPGYKFDQNTKFTVNGGSTDHYGNPGFEEADFYVCGPMVTFDPNGGSVGVTAKEVKSNGKLETLPTPTWGDNSMVYMGWYDAKTGGKEISINTVFTNDTTVYARWGKYCDVYGHNWDAATCTAPKTCSVCKTTEGSAAGHKWTAATCTAAKTCSVCKTTEGSAAGHKWTAATCTAAKTCSVCKTTEGSAAGHKWTAATCTAPKTCSVCKTTEGKAKGHSWDSGKVTKEPTTQEKGVKTFTCTACKTTRTEEIAKLEVAVQGVTRLAGADRYKTAFLAADQLKVQLGVQKFDVVVVASGTEFADALSGSYLAAVKNAPMLLVRNNKTTLQLVKDYIKANLKSGGTVYILGGENAVPKTMESGLEGFTVKRLGGATRYDTNLIILKEAGVGNKDILVCTGKGFADSLSASAAKLPILLVKDSFTSAQKEFLKTAKGKLYIIGGTSAVSAKVESTLKTYGTVKRLGGATRYETSVLVAQEFFAKPTAAVLAYAQNFPDGLSGGALAAAIDAPLILTASGKDAAAAKYTKGLGIKDGYILGGNTLIGDKAVKNIYAMAATDAINVIK